MSDYSWGERLRAFRVRMKMKQEAAAEQLGISQAYVSRLEAGTMQPSPEIVARLECLLTAPGNRDHFDHWRAAIRQCAGYATITREHGDHICLVEFSRGMRSLGEPFASFEPGIIVGRSLGRDIARRIGFLTATGVFRGEVQRVEHVWRAESQTGNLYFDTVNSPVRDDHGNWHVFSCHCPISREEYLDHLSRPANLRVVRHAEFADS